MLLMRIPSEFVVAWSKLPSAKETLRTASALQCVPGRQRFVHRSSCEDSSALLLVKLSALEHQWELLHGGSVREGLPRGTVREKPVTVSV